MVRQPRRVDVLGLSMSDVEALEQATALPLVGRETSRWAARDRLLVGLLARCGLRVGEVCALKVVSVDESGEQPIVRVRDGAKGGRHRDVPLPHHLVEVLHTYLGEREGWRPADRLLVRRDGVSGLNQQFVDGVLRRLCALAGVVPPEGAMAHALRHSYGSELARRGVPVFLIPQLLGHTDPRTSSIYTGVHLR